LDDDKKDIVAINYNGHIIFGYSAKKKDFRLGIVLTLLFLTFPISLILLYTPKINNKFIDKLFNWIEEVKKNER